MIAYKIYLILPLSLFLFNCTNQSADYHNINIGSNIDAEGKISNRNVTYTFKRKSNLKTIKDLYNHLYFAGDILGFTIVFDEKPEQDQLNIIFINADNHRYISAERIDILENRVSGFCLIGSLMEQFYKNKLNDAPSDLFYEQHIPVIIQLKVKSASGKETIYTKKTVFEVKYRN